MNLEFQIRLSRNYPRWSIRTEKYANGQISHIANFWWLNLSVTTGNE